MGELEDTRRDIHWDFLHLHVQLPLTIMLPVYQSLTITALESTSGLLLMVLLKGDLMEVTVLVVVMQDILLLNNYYCEAAPLDAVNTSAFFFDDPLWDRAGCTGGSSCCNDITQPWFYRQLNQTTQDDIEARICAYRDYGYGSTLIDQFELYIQ